MNIQHKEEGSKGSFYVAGDNSTLAAMTYTMAAADLMIIDHTEVDDALRGKNVGNQLLNVLVEYARDNHIKILPLCPFAKSVFDKKKDEFADVLRTN
jgi:hypothetical protein